MGIYDSIDNKLRNLRSKHDEVVKVDGIRAEMQEVNDVIREQIYLIGQFYWQKYFDGEYAPGEDKVFFDEIDRCNEEIRHLMNKVEDCKVEGLTERETIDYATNSRIEQRMAEAEERRRLRAEDKERRNIEKEHLRIENAERRRVQKEENDRIAKEKAIERALEKERLAAEKAARKVEKDRIAAEKAAERAAEKERLAAEKAAKKAHIAAEKAEKARAEAEALARSTEDDGQPKG